MLQVRSVVRRGGHVCAGEATGRLTPAKPAFTQEVRDAVAQFLATPGPALLDAVVEPYALSLPAHVSFGEAEGFSLSFAKQALNGNLDDVIQTVKRNVHLV